MTNSLTIDDALEPGDHLYAEADDGNVSIVANEHVWADRYRTAQVDLDIDGVLTLRDWLTTWIESR